MFPAKRKDKGQKGFDSIPKDSLGLTDKNDLFFKENSFKYTDNSLKWQKLKNTVYSPFLRYEKFTEMIG